MKVQLEFTLDEIDLVSAIVSRDRDRVLVAAGYSGTRLLTDQERTLVPLHQQILRRIEAALTPCSSPRPNQGIATLLGVDPAYTNGIAKVRALCNTFSLETLRITIDLHRLSCHQPDCPALAMLVSTAESRLTLNLGEAEIAVVTR